MPGAANARADGAARARIRMFGAIAIEDGAGALGPRDLGGVKMRQLFEVLLAARGRPVPKARLALHLWGEKQPQNVRPALEHCVCVLRRSLAAAGPRAEQLVVTQSGAYRFLAEEADVDLDRFDELVERAEGTSGAARRGLLEDALLLVRGDVLEDEQGALWAKALRETYRRRVDDIRLDAAEAALAARDFRGALAHAHTASESDAFSERPHQIAMLAQYALGRQHQALEAFGRLRASLASELGIEPMPETRSLHEAIRGQVDAESLLPPREAGAEVVSVGAEPTPAAGGLPVVTIVERNGTASLRNQVEPLAQTLGASIGAARCGKRRRSAVDALGAALIDAVGENGFRDGLRTKESVVEAIRSHAPVMLVVEDLHRADAESVEVLEELQSACADVPVVVLASYRASGVPAGHPLAAAAAASIVSGDAAKTWLMRVAAPLIGALRYAVLLPFWFDEFFGLDEAFAVVSGAVV